MSRQSIFEVLPFEVLDLVFNESKRANPKEHTSLRLVCKDISKIVGSQAFSTVSIEFTRKTEHTIQPKLKHIASGLGPYSQWAKKLRIGRLVAVDGGQNAIQWDSSIERSLVASQARWLIPAIQALPHIEEVEVSISTQEPCQEVLFALANSLPFLKKLSLFFVGVSMETQFRIPLGSFSGLTNLELCNMPSLADLISTEAPPRAPSTHFTELEEIMSSFHINSSDTVDGESPLNMPPPQGAINLRSLKVNLDGLQLLPSCIPFLRSLTHLHVRNLSPSCSFWKAMQRSGIELQVLNHPPPLNQPAIDYLLSFAGLRELTFGCYHGGITGELEVFCDQLFASVLPNHRATLQILASMQRPFDSWCITAERLENLGLCQDLRQLHLVYCTPTAIDNVTVYPAVPFAHLLSSIAQNLPLLQELVLQFTSLTGLPLGTTHERIAPQINKCEFDIPLPIVREPQFYLNLPNGLSFRPVKVANVRVRYRFQMEDSEAIQ